MNNELFEKRILFESLSCIMENQKRIMKQLGIIKYDSVWGYNDDYVENLIGQCEAIVDKARWEENNNT